MANKTVITAEIQFKPDDSKMQGAFKNLVASLNDVQKAAELKFVGDDNKAKLNETIQQVERLKVAFQEAYKPGLNTFDLNILNQELKKQGVSISDITKKFSELGATGAKAFTDVSREITKTQNIAQKTTGVFDKLGETLGNTLRWTATSGLINNITGSIQNAWNYANKLDASLNDIRIVTGKSANEMKEFAKQANNAAQALGASTTDYTNAALIYYQQGLSDSEVAARTNITIKAANVTGQSAAEVSEQLTAVWNGYKVVADEAELYVDKLAAVAAATAADLEEISEGMSKVASAASTMGVDIDQLTAQLSTIISVTRQDASVVGTALKTIYARLGDLEVDGIDEFGTKLGDVSGKMRQMGIEVLDENGNLREMGAVIEEVAAKWRTWTDAQQQAAAVAMAGKRQYNNLIALFENWDMYESSIATSKSAEGTLEEQQQTYEERIEALIQSMETAGEGIMGEFFDAGSIGDFTNAIETLSEAIEWLVGAFGGLKNILPGILGLLGSLSPKFVDSISRGLFDIGASIGKTFEEFSQAINIKKAFGELDKSLKDSEKKMVSFERAGLGLKRLFDSGFIDQETFTDLNEHNNAVIRLTQRYQDIEKAKERVETDKSFSKNGVKITAQDYQDSAFEDKGSKKQLEEINEQRAAVDLLQKEYDELVASMAKAEKKGETIAEEQKNNLSSKRSELEAKKENLELQEEEYNKYQEYFSAIENDTLELDQIEDESLRKKLENYQILFKSEKDLKEAKKKAAEAEEKRNKLLQESGIKGMLVSQSLTQTLTTTMAITSAVGTIADAWQGVEEGTVGVGQALTSSLTSIVSLIPAIGSAIDLIKTMNTLTPGVGTTMAIIGAVVAVGGAIWTAVDRAIKAQEKADKAKAKAASENFNAANESAKKLKETVSELRDEYDALLDSMSSYQSAQNALKRLTEGTLEWKAAATDLNAQVLDLLDKYPELATFISTSENGVMSIGEGGFDAIKQNSFNAINRAQRASAVAQMTRLGAQNDLIYANAEKDGYAGLRNDFASYLSLIDSGNVKDANQLLEKLNEKQKENILALYANTKAMEVLEKSYTSSFSDSEVGNSGVFAQYLQAIGEKTRITQDDMKSSGTSIFSKAGQSEVALSNIIKGMSFFGPGASVDIADDFFDGINTFEKSLTSEKTIKINGTEYTLRDLYNIQAQSELEQNLLSKYASVIGQLKGAGNEAEARKVLLRDATRSEALKSFGFTLAELAGTGYKNELEGYLRDALGDLKVENIDNLTVSEAKVLGNLSGTPKTLIEGLLSGKNADQTKAIAAAVSGVGDWNDAGQLGYFLEELRDKGFPELEGEWKDFIQEVYDGNKRWKEDTWAVVNALKAAKEVYESINIGDTIDEEQYKALLEVLDPETLRQYFAIGADGQYYALQSGEAIQKALFDRYQNTTNASDLRAAQREAASLATSWADIRDSEFISQDIKDEWGKIWANKYALEAGLSSSMGMTADTAFEYLEKARMLEIDFYKGLEQQIDILKEKSENLFGTELAENLTAQLSATMGMAAAAQSKASWAEANFSTIGGGSYLTNGLLDFEKLKGLDEKTRESVVNAYEAMIDAQDEAREKTEQVTDAQVALIKAEITSAEKLKKFSDALQNISNWESWDSSKNGAAASLSNLLLSAEYNQGEVGRQVSALEEIDLYLENSKEYQDQLLNTAKAVQDLQKNLSNLYAAEKNALSEIANLYEKQISEIKTVNDLLKSQANLSTLIGQDSSKIYQSIAANSQRIWNQTLEEYNALAAQYDEARAEQNDKNMAHLADLMGKTAKNLADQASQMFTAIAESFNATITAEINSLVKTASGFETLTALSEDWSRATALDDRYLDDVNAAYGISGIERKFKKSINETDSLTAQKKLNTVMEAQLKLLREKDKLSQSDLDRANAEYELALKQIALQEAQQTKNKMKLVRDASGNYTYQYVQDEDAISQAEEELAAIENSLYNLDKDRTKSLITDFLALWQEGQQKLQEAVASGDELRIQKVKDYYFGNGGLLTALQDEIGLMSDFANQTEFGHMVEIVNGFGLNEFNQSLSTSVNNAATQIGEAKTNIASLLGDNSPITQAIGKLNDTLTNPESELGQITTSLKELSGKIGSLNDYAKTISDFIEGKLNVQINSSSNNQSTDENTKALNNLTNATLTLIDSMEEGAERNNGRVGEYSKNDAGMWDLKAGERE